MAADHDLLVNMTTADPEDELYGKNRVQIVAVRVSTSIVCGRTLLVTIGFLRNVTDDIAAFEVCGNVSELVSLVDYLQGVVAAVRSVQEDIAMGDLVTGKEEA